MDAASGIAAQIAQTRQNVAFSAIKQNAQAEQQIADILQQSSDATAVPNSPVRGTNVDLSA
jgi:hypothetical protein